MRYSQELELRRLAGEISEWKFEHLRLRLAEGAWYKPDFFVLLADGRIELHETKGQWREAARVRIKVASELHPWFRFRAIQWDKKRGWIVEEF